MTKASGQYREPYFPSDAPSMTRDDQRVTAGQLSITVDEPRRRHMSLEWPEWLTPGERSFFLATCLAAEEAARFDRRTTSRPGYCAICRFDYVPSIPSNRASHRRRHVISMRPHRPKPDPEFANNVDVVVDKTSAKKLHKLVFERARALQRDSGYSLQWCEDRAPSEDKFVRRVHAILLIEDSTPVGVVSFAWMRWTDGTPHGWRMLMAWIAEPWRRKGLLSRRWDRWRETYGEFSIERPVSRGMANFLARHGVAVSVEDLVGKPTSWL